MGRLKEPHIRVPVVFNTQTEPEATLRPSRLQIYGDPRRRQIYGDPQPLPLALAVVMGGVWYSSGKTCLTFCTHSGVC